MSNLPTSIQLGLPDWLGNWPDEPRVYADDESRVGLAIDLARRNVENNTGGPFGAAVFTLDWQLVSVGVNRVIPQNCSVAHAEMMACETPGYSCPARNGRHGERQPVLADATSLAGEVEVRMRRA